MKMEGDQQTMDIDELPPGETNQQMSNGKSCFYKTERTLLVLSDCSVALKRHCVLFVCPLITAQPVYI